MQLCQEIPAPWVPALSFHPRAVTNSLFLRGSISQVRAGSAGDCKDVCEAFFLSLKCLLERGHSISERSSCTSLCSAKNQPCGQAGQRCHHTNPKNEITESHSLTLPRASLSCFSAAACLVLASLTILWASCTRESFKSPAAPQLTQPTRQVTHLPQHTFQTRGQTSLTHPGGLLHQLCLP